MHGKNLWIGLWAGAMFVAFGLNAPVSPQPGDMAGWHVIGAIPDSSVGEGHWTSPGGGQFWRVPSNGGFVEIWRSPEKKPESVPLDFRWPSFPAETRELLPDYVRQELAAQKGVGGIRSVSIRGAVASQDFVFLLYTLNSSMFLRGIHVISVKNPYESDDILFLGLDPRFRWWELNPIDLVGVVGDQLYILQFNCERPPVIVLDWRNKMILREIGRHASPERCVLGKSGQRIEGRPHAVVWPDSSRMVLIYPQGPGARAFGYDLPTGRLLWETDLDQEVAPSLRTRAADLWESPKELEDWIWGAYLLNVPLFACFQDGFFLTKDTLNGLWSLSPDGQWRFLPSDLDYKALVRCCMDGTGRLWGIRRQKNGSGLAEIVIPQALESP